MKIIIPHKSRIKKVLRALSSLASNVKMPILQNILLIANDGVELIGTDLEITACLYLPDVESSRKEKVLIPSSSLYEIFSRTNSDVVIKKEESGITINTNNTEFGVPTLDPGSFPSYPSLEEKEPTCTVLGDNLSQAIKSVHFATASQKQPSPMRGVHFKAKDNVLYCEATDSHILARAKIPCEGDDFDCVVGSKILKLASKFWADNEVRIFSTDRTIIFVMPYATIFGQLMEGQFPGTKSIFQKKPKLAVFADKEDLTEMLQRAFIIAKRSYTNRVTWLISDNSLRVQAKNDTGTVVSKIEGENIETTQKEDLMPFTIKMNCNYILQILRRLEGRVKVGMISPTSPILVKSGSGLSRYVLMPQTTEGETDDKN